MKGQDKFKANSIVQCKMFRQDWVYLKRISRKINKPLPEIIHILFDEHAKFSQQLIDSQPDAIDPKPKRRIVVKNRDKG